MLLKQWYFHQLRMSLFESEPCTLQSYHNVVCLLYIYLLSFVLIFCQEGGLDIVGEDNIHYKLATHVICVFSKPDAQNITNNLTRPTETNWLHLSLPPPLVPPAIPFNLTAILSGLQGGLQKSREMGAELYHPTGLMSGIHNTLSRSLVSFCLFVYYSLMG